MKKYINYLSVALLVSMLISIEKAKAQYTIPAKMNWWYEARFGMFIHFGSYSYLGQGEWAFSNNNYTKNKYQTQVSAKFNPVNFDAGAIAKSAKMDGMKYMVITAKHHEGFCMWQTAVTSFTDTSGTKLYDLPDFTVFNKRDILQELKDSCDAQGIKFCLYYSIMDWDHSSQRINHSTYYTDMASDSARTDYIRDMKAQLKELITKYHPAVMWFDGDWTYNSGSPTLRSWWTENDGKDLYNYLIGLDSNLVVNERVCRSFGLGDFECPEQTVPTAPKSRPWETCQTMNTSWGYTSKDNAYKSPTTLIQQLVQVVSCDGNYLLNIGPEGDGTMTPQSVSILSGFADWMGIFSESIYGTTRSPYSTEPVWGYYTKKSTKLYAHVFEWPTNGLLKVPSLTNTINKIFLLNDSTTSLNYLDSNGYIRITIPTIAPNAINSVVVISLSGVPTVSTAYIKTNKITVTGFGGATSISGNSATLQMQATVFPTFATDKTVSWSVSDTSIASISTSGLLTAKKYGIVTVTALANDESDIEAQEAISITNPTNAVSQENTFILFPNPVVNGKLTIEQTEESNLSIAMYNCVGTLVLQQNMDGKTLVIDVSTFSSGVYIVKASNGDRIITQQFVKE